MLAKIDCNAKHLTTLEPNLSFADFTISQVDQVDRGSTGYAFHNESYSEKRSERDAIGKLIVIAVSTS